MSNKLKIDAKQIKLEFTGDKDDIRRGYEMTRELLIMHFHEQLSRAEQESEATATKPPPLPAAAQPATQRAVTQAQWTPRAVSEGEPLHISIALCSDFYNKVCVLERESFDKSIFKELLDFGSIQRLYIRSSQGDAIKRHLSIGKVLWRELTPDGRAAVRAEGT